MSRRSEREAARKIEELFERNRVKGTDFDLHGDTSYGSGRLTRAQRKSQERHIPLTPAPQTAGQKLKRAWFG